MGYRGFHSQPRCHNNQHQAINATTDANFFIAQVGYSGR
jgi:hypothetical protein